MPPTRVLRGASGAQQISPEAIRVPQVSRGFVASVTTVRTGFVSITRLEASAFSARRTLSRIASFPVDEVHVIMVVRGSIRVRQDGRAHLIGADHATLLRTGASYEYALSQNSEIMTITLARGLLTLAAQRELRAVTATVVKRSLLLETMLAFVRPVLAAGHSSVEF